MFDTHPPKRKLSDCSLNAGEAGYRVKHDCVKWPKIVQNRGPKTNSHCTKLFASIQRTPSF